MTTLDDYLSKLPEDRRASIIEGGSKLVIEQLRAEIAEIQANAAQVEADCKLTYKMLTDSREQLHRVYERERRLEREAATLVADRAALLKVARAAQDYAAHWTIFEQPADWEEGRNRLAFSLSQAVAALPEHLKTEE